MPAAPTEVIRLAPADRDRVFELMTRCPDYFDQHYGHPATQVEADEIFDDAPPGCDPARSIRLGLMLGGRLEGLAELAFGFPEAADAYLGLMLLTPSTRGRGLGRELLAEVERHSREAGASRLFLAAIEANARGRAFWEGCGFSFAHDGGERRIGNRIQRLTRFAKTL